MPAGYLAAEFLENQNKAYIQISAPFNDAIGICVCQSQEATTADVAAINARPQDSRFYSPYMFNGNWYIGWNTWDVIKQYSNAEIAKKSEVKLNYFNDRKASVKNSLEHFSYELTQTLPDAGSAIFSFFFYAQGSRFFKGKIFYAKMTEDNRIIRDFIPCINEAGKPCFYEKKSGQPFYTRLGEFIVGLTLKQALQLSKLPATGGNLTVSLPWEAQLVQHNADVESALQTAKNNGWTITVQYRDPEPDNAYYNKYAQCATVADMAAVNPDYKHDLTVDGDWIYPTSAIVDGSRMFGWRASYMIRGYFYLPNMTTAVDFANQGSKLVEAEVYAPNATSLHYMFHDQNNLKKVSGDFSKLKNAREFACNTSLTDLIADFPSLSDAELFALNCSSVANRPKLNKTSVLRILNSIPSYINNIHRLGLGIHIDHQADEEVLAAIADAEAKGWTLTVQWNGTATASATSTFGLRSPSIYAKLTTIELPDGTTKTSLGWGHYVTNWEENGYQEFGSVEEAEEHFNIKQTEEHEIL